MKRTRRINHEKTYIRPLLKMLDYRAEGNFMGLPAVVSDPTFNGAHQQSFYDEELDEQIPDFVSRHSVWDEE